MICDVKFCEAEKAVLLFMEPEIVAMTVIMAVR